MTLLLIALSPPLAAQQGQQSLLDADRAAARLTGDSGISAGIVGSLDSAGAVLWPGAPVLVGAKEVKQFLSGWRTQDSLRLSWQPLAVELARDSSIGFTWGVAVATPRKVAGAPRLGRYIAVWRRQGDRWTIAAMALVGTVPATSSPVPSGVPLTREPARAAGKAVPFVSADLAFARLAGDSGAAVAFRRWAADDAVTFGGEGLLTRGPEAIGRAVAGPERWRWHPVLAGAAASGELGWTVGEAVIAAPQGEPFYSKYLTIWGRRSGGSVRFLVDGGNARPPTP